MFKNHPKGLITAALANMGERFGFYTMMAVLTLFLQSKFGLGGTKAGIIFATFYFSTYIMAFVGGIIADRTRNYKGTIMIGLLVMTAGYVLIALPTPTSANNNALFLVVTCLGLLTIALGNGLFKGNLQAMVGQMYDNETFGKMRDSGFSLFYMFINIGALFAPIMAIGARNFWLFSHGFQYNAGLPELCHAHLSGTITPEAAIKLAALAKEVTIAPGAAAISDMTSFARDYIGVFTDGFHLAFAISVVAMFVSLAIYLLNKKSFPTPGSKKATTASEDGIDTSEIRRRIYALFAVFGVVIFFWFAFHQGGLTLTFFAKDYTAISGLKLNLGFTSIEGAEIFQSVNPLFIILLTPIIIALFGWMRAKGTEPSTPRKIAIGMAIAAFAYVIMAAGSFSLPLKSDVDAMGGLAESAKVTPLLLTATYFVLTLAELFISPLGISFVSKVAPPQYQGIMQGGWFSATAIGNQLLFIGAVLYDSVPIWVAWSMFVVTCFMSMAIMLFMVRWLERVAK